MMQQTESTAARAWGIALSLTSLLAISGLRSADAVRVQTPRGEQLFLKLCASCHGEKGQGGKAYAKPLVGTRSAGQLAQFIERSMPPGGAHKWTGSDAQEVAEYIHGAFYSPLAQERNRAARVELSHLTVRQYRNAVADLLARFRPAFQPGKGRGLRGEYFKTGQTRRGQRILERIDPQIRFDFGTGGALPEQDDPYTFAMTWEGSMLAPDTGEYEFIVRTEHAVRLWVNDLRRPLIDGYVKSGDGDEYSAPLFLLGGRWYPVRIEFSKGVVGVNDLKKLKEKPPARATLALEWKRPKLAREVIPERCLLPDQAPELYVVTTPFPPDDRSTGYERGNSVSKGWQDAVTEAALETAAYVAERMGEQLGLRAPERRVDSFGGNPASINLQSQADNSTPQEKANRVREFCRRFVETAFRRPLTPEIEKLYIDRQLAAAPDLETGLKRVVILTLKSPRFLYRELEQNDSYAVASRLAFTLWDSLPDAELLRAAQAGELGAPAQVQAQAERMLADTRAWFKLREFLLQWLKVEQPPDLAKDPKRYPEFNAAVASDLRTSLELFLEQAAWGPKSDFRELLLSESVFLNGRLAKVYGAELPPDAPFQPVALEPTHRAGVLTHPYLLAAFAYLDTSSPIHRGVLIARNLLGRVLQPPPEAFAPVPAELHPELTTRQRVAMQTRPAACMSCHDMINPLGFTLERFDAIGRFRLSENGKPVDSSGRYETRDGRTVRFSSVRDLARFLATSDESHEAFVEKLFQYAVKQPIRAFGPATLPELNRTFEAGDLNIRVLMREIAVAAAMNVLKDSSARAGSSLPGG